MDNGTLINIRGDATCPQFTHKNEIAIIPHVCNSINAWGAGFVMALSAKDKTPEICYKSMFNPIPAPSNEKDMLGRVSFASFGPASYYEYGNEVKKCKSQIFVANMIAQSGTKGTSNYDIPLRYEALIKCMKKVAEWIKKRSNRDNNNYVIHAPKFGSDLAGGNWDFILELIREIWLESGISVVIYEFVK